MGQASKGATKRIFLLPYSSCCRRCAAGGAAIVASAPVGRRQSCHTANVVSCCCLSLANFGPWLYLVLAHCSSLGSPLLQRRKLRPAPSDSIGTLEEFKVKILCLRHTQESYKSAFNTVSCKIHQMIWDGLFHTVLTILIACFSSVAKWQHRLEWGVL